MSILSAYIIPHAPILLPEIGEGRERKAQTTLSSLEKISNHIASLKPETIIVITPHGTMFNDSMSIIQISEISGGFEKFDFEELQFTEQIDIELTQEIIELNPRIETLNIESEEALGIHIQLDWGVLVPLYFIRKQWADYELVVITYGMLVDTELYSFGKTIQKAVNQLNRKAIVIASGDLSHALSDDGPYAYHPDGHSFDHQVCNAIKNNPLTVYTINQNTQENANQCGLNSIKVMLGSLDGNEMDSKLYSYEGPFGVGYAVAAIIPLKASELSGLNWLYDLRNKRVLERHNKEHAYVKLARRSIQYYMANKDFIALGELESDKRGVFVSIQLHGQLRGCIGTIEPNCSSIMEEIIQNSVSAAFYDPRFLPLTMDELEESQIKVDVLSKPEKCTKDQLNPLKFGCIVSFYEKRGVLLPDLEGIDTVEQQLTIALKKAGINRLVPYQIERFEVTRFH